MSDQPPEGPMSAEEAHTALLFLLNAVKARELARVSPTTAREIDELSAAAAREMDDTATHLRSLRELVDRSGLLDLADVETLVSLHAETRGLRDAQARAGLGSESLSNLASRFTTGRGATRTGLIGPATRNDEPQVEEVEHDEQYYDELRHQVLRRGSWSGLFGTSSRALNKAVDRLRSADTNNTLARPPDSPDKPLSPEAERRAERIRVIKEAQEAEAREVTPEAEAQQTTEVNPRAAPRRSPPAGRYLQLTDADTQELQARLLAMRNELANRETTPANYHIITTRIDTLAVDLRGPAPDADVAMENIREIKQYTADDAVISGMIDQLEQRIQQTRRTEHGAPVNLIWSDDHLGTSQSEPVTADAPPSGQPGPTADFEVHGRRKTLYLIQKGNRGWQALVRNGPTWVDAGYHGATSDEVLRQLRADGKVQ